MLPSVSASSGRARVGDSELDRFCHHGRFDSRRNDSSIAGGLKLRGCCCQGLCWPYSFYPLWKK